MMKNLTGDVGCMLRVDEYDESCVQEHGGE